MGRVSVSDHVAITDKSVFLRRLNSFRFDFHETSLGTKSLNLKSESFLRGSLSENR